MPLSRWAVFVPVIILLASSRQLSAQARLDTLSVRIQSTRQALSAVLEQLEHRYGIRIFKPKGVGRDVNVTLDLAPTLLPLALDRLLENTGLSYLIYRDQAIVIGDRALIERDFGVNYYQALEEALTIEKENEDKEEQPVIIGELSSLSAEGMATVSGRVTDAESGDAITGATLYIPELEKGTPTDAEGRFELTLPSGAYQLVVQYVGYGEKQLDLRVYSDGELPISLSKQSVALQEVIVEARAPDANVARVMAGVTQLDIKSIKKLPSFLGEVDLVRSLLLQPGISSIGEGVSGFNVQGGNIDQNLIMQDEAFLFNSSHAIGFFSTFNNDLVSSVELFKGIMPAQFGGRLAGVLDVEMRSGNFEEFRMRGGLSPVTARLSMETPVVKDRSSVIAGFRGAYSDWILGLIKVPEVQESSASFYDANLRYTHRLSDVHSLSLSGYTAWDRFRYADEFGFNYRTNSAQTFLRSVFSKSLLSRFSLTYSQYTSQEEDFSGGDASILENAVTYLKAKEQLTFTPANDLSVNGGGSAIRYWVDPGSTVPASPESSAPSRQLEQEKGLETATFLSAEWSPSAAFSMAAGLRFAWYAYLGPRTVFQYSGEGPPALSGITDTLRYSKRERIASYTSLEPRFSARYRFGPATSVKAGYSRTAQFINQVTDATSPTPTSTWQLSTPHIEPQRSHNFSLGFFQNFRDNQWETSAEIYYRLIDKLFDYRDFADLTVNEHLETELLPGEGRAYGLELSIKRKTGRLNGWISYTLSRSELKVQGVGNNSWYPANYDKPQDLTIVLNFLPTERQTFSLNFTYSSGRPTTAPLGTYTLTNGLNVLDYSARNQLRIPDYHRLDLAYTFGQGYNKTKRFKTSWTVSLYNVYGRRNAFSVYFTQKPFNPPKANRLSILGGVFPSLTFNFELI
jgi:hypothetical protein